MKSAKRGQSIVEYSVILVLVFLGVVIMGPYVLRSVNAHFKLWDDQVQDSFNDRLKQAPSDQVSIPGNCRVEQKIKGSCGPVQGKTVTCKENERYIYTTFNPPGCYIAESCETDPQCCNPAIRGNCGTRPRDAGAESRRTTGLTINGKAIYEPVNPLGSSNGCYYGEREILRRCGAAPETIIGCVVDTFGREFDLRDGRLPPGQQPVTGPDGGFSTDDDDPSCAAMCIGTAPGAIPPNKPNAGQPIATLCPNDDRNLPADTAIKFIDPGSQNCTIAKCEFNCNCPYVPNGAQTTCIDCSNIVTGVEFPFGENGAPVEIREDSCGHFRINARTGTLSMTFPGCRKRSNHGFAYPKIKVKYANNTSEIIDLPTHLGNYNIQLPGDWSFVSAGTASIPGFNYPNSGKWRYHRPSGGGHWSIGGANGESFGFSYNDSARKASGSLHFTVEFNLTLSSEYQCNKCPGYSDATGNSTRPQVCGNEIIDPGESCDLGLGCHTLGQSNGRTTPCQQGNVRNGDPGSSCSNTCQTILCGNGIVDRYIGEECDLAENNLGTPCEYDVTKDTSTVRGRTVGIDSNGCSRSEGIIKSSFCSASCTKINKWILEDITSCSASATCADSFNRTVNCFSQSASCSSYTQDQLICTNNECEIPSCGSDKVSNLIKTSADGTLMGECCSTTKNSSLSSCLGYPATQEYCIDPCYDWMYGPWKNNCSLPCGGGVESRDVFCQDRSGAIATGCKGTPESNTRACNTTSCGTWQEQQGSCQNLVKQNPTDTTCTGNATVTHQCPSGTICASPKPLDFTRSCTAPCP